MRAGAAVASRGENGWVARFIAAMDHTARGRARALAHAVQVNGDKRMLDLGGGSGAYSIAFVKAASALEAEIVDLPEVLPITQEHIRRAGLANRISTRAGDMLTIPLESGRYDLVLLSAICHMYSPEENRQLFERAYAALAPQGRLVVSDFILEADEDCTPIRRSVRVEYAGGHARGRKLQRTGVRGMVESSRLLPRPSGSAFPGRPT